MKHSFLPALITTGLIPAASHAALIATENFDYSNGSIAGQSGGTGWNYERTDEPAAPAQTASNWNDTFGDAQVVSTALVTSGSGAHREFGGITEGTGGDSNEREGAFRGTGTMFFSVSYTPNTANQWGGVSSYDFGTERIFWGAPGGTPGGNFFGIDVAGDQTVSTIPVVTGQTYTLIGMLDFDNDLLGLWVDPDGSDTVTSHDVSAAYTGGNWSSALRLASGHESTWDDLRVGTTFADVAPVPEPSTGLLGLAAAGLLFTRRRR
ncbi:PEP-CTERM sorting domain-containing protein [Luteolibacter marinus]|uniref:PEP-CTERM sorting domain-containing protein n=1 Tax=Luteolibacter marinus TaxID=2776705 RepID=UPI001869526A